MPAHKVPQVLKAPQVIMELKVFLVPLVLKAPQGLQVLQDLQVHKVLSAWMVSMVSKV
jgi:hypothetical protein